MPFPIVLVSPLGGDYDKISPVINFAANAALVTTVSTAVAVVTCLALKALGYGVPATKLISFLPVAVAIGGGVAVVASTTFIIYAVVSVVKILRSEI